MTTLERAQRYLMAGLSVIPIKADGSKAPPIAWKEYQRRTATEAELSRWFHDDAQGIAIVGGKVSGGLEILDFDDRPTYDAWSQLVEQQAPGLLALLPQVKTPSGGVHVYYRCAHPPGNAKLAEALGDKGKYVLIETRGEGGYVLAPGCPAACHPDKGLYTQFSGPALNQLKSTHLEPELRDLLWSAARSFNRVVNPGLEPDRRPANTTALRPGDDFNKRSSWEEILPSAGWSKVGQTGRTTLWRRPGKSGRAWSGTTGHCHTDGSGDLFYVFSSNAFPFESGKTYSKFAAYSILQHEGNYQAATKELAARGYGEMPIPTQPRLSNVNGHSNGKGSLETESSEAWEEPIPFHEAIGPGFPVDCLPDWLAEFVLALADATQTPPDLSAMLALAFAAGAAQGRFRVLAREGWAEPCNLYVVVVLPPGNRKSAVFSVLVKPAQIREQEEADRLRPLIAEQESQRRILESRVKAAEAATAREEEPTERRISEEHAKRLARELAELKVQPVPKLYADDATPEALVGLLAEQGGTMLLASAEGTIFDIAKGRYSEKPNFDVFLKAHAGDAIRVSRVGRDPEAIDAPALTLAVTVQPAVIQGLAECAPMKGQGFLARFLYSLPVSLVGRRKIARPAVPEHMIESYQQALLALYRTPLAPTGRDGEVGPNWLHLTPEAAAHLQTYEATLEPQLAEDAELGAIQDWGCKLAGAAVRIAGLLHLLRHAGAYTPEWIELETMQAATRITQEYLLPHSLCAHGLLGLDPRVNLAQKILGWLAEQGKPTVTRREIHYRFKRTVSKVEDIEPPLELLERHGFLRLHGSFRQPTGGRSSQLYMVNPLFLKSKNTGH